MTYQVAMLGFGLLLLLVGLIGRVKAKEVEIGTTSMFARVATALIGSVLVVLSFWLIVKPPVPPTGEVTVKTPPIAVERPDEWGAGSRMPANLVSDANGGNLLVFQNNFDTPDRAMESRNPGEGNCTFEDGWLMVENTSQDATRGYLFPYRLAGTFPSSVLIEVDARLVQGSKNRRFGVVFGANETGESPFSDYYGFFVTADGWYGVLRMSQGAWTPLVSVNRSDVIKPGIGLIHRLRVEARGRSIAYSVNDTLLGTVDTDREVGGGIGFFVDYAGMVVAFDNLRISQPGKKSRL